MLRRRPGPALALALTRSVLVTSLGLASAGCSETMYAYVPTANAGAAVGGQPAADYPLPPTAPRGDVKIASYGITDVHPKDNPRITLGAVHLHAEVANTSDRVWSFDTREQMLSLEGHGSGAPAFAFSDATGPQPPLVTVAPGQKRDVDLFYILPKDLQDSDTVPSFACAWRVNTGEAIIAETTPFQRVEIDEDAVPAYAASGPSSPYWDGPYWINPYYPYGGFYGAVLVPGAYWGGGIYVHRGPYFGGFHGGYRGGFSGGWHGGGSRGGGGHGGGGHGGGHR